MRSILDVCEQLWSKRNAEITLLDAFTIKITLFDAFKNNLIEN